jgi:hypothetical protein
MSAFPFLKFYADAWRSDPALRSCSIGARGLWIEMLCLMHGAEPRGHLRLPNGAAITDRQLALQVGISADELSRLRDELRAAGVFDVAADGTIISRRMVRDERVRLAKSAAGKQGGNPVLKQPLKLVVNRVLKPISTLASPEEAQTYQGRTLPDDDPFGGEGAAA